MENANAESILRWRLRGKAPKNDVDLTPEMKRRLKDLNPLMANSNSNSNSDESPRIKMLRLRLKLLRQFSHHKKITLSDADLLRPIATKIADQWSDKWSLMSDHERERVWKITSNSMAPQIDFPPVPRTRVEGPKKEFPDVPTGRKVWLDPKYDWIPVPKGSKLRAVNSKVNANGGGDKNGNGGGDDDELLARLREWRQKISEIIAN